MVIDAGHGGADPGKVGVNGSLEKDINLKIAEMVKSFLETEGVNVVCIILSFASMECSSSSHT